MFDKIRERVRDHSRDELCTHLCALGIKAQMSERGRPEEKITRWRGKSLGIIDIQDALIRWVDVKIIKGADPGDESGGIITTWYIEYGVPDSRITAGFHKVKIKVVDFKWEGKDFGLGLIDRLSDDVSLNKPILGTIEFEIGAYPEHSCWILLQHDLLAPSVELWDCYQTIARHLLAISIPPHP